MEDRCGVELEDLRILVEGEHLYCYARIIVNVSIGVSLRCSGIKTYQGTEYMVEVFLCKVPCFTTLMKWGTQGIQ